jgi:hypothetical protein
VIMAQLGLNLQLVDVMGSFMSDTTPAAVTYYDYSQNVGNSYTAELNLTVLVNRCVSASWTTGTNERSIYLERQ